MPGSSSDRRRAASAANAGLIFVLLTTSRARTWRWRRMRRYGELSRGRERSSPRRFFPDCTIAMPGHDFREGQGIKPCVGEHPLKRLPPLVPWPRSNALLGGPARSVSLPLAENWQSTSDLLGPGVIGGIPNIPPTEISNSSLSRHRQEPCPLCYDFEES